MLSLATMGKDSDLLQAVKAEDIRGITRILAKFKSSKPKLLGSSKKININAQDCDGISSLHQAALMCSVPIIQLLLDAGAQVDIKDNRGMRPLHYASWQGKPEPVSLLLQYNSSVNEYANKGETPLHLACQHGHVLVTNLLLKYHSNILVRNKDHKSPLDLACEFGRYEVVQMLLQHQSRFRSLLSENPQDLADNDRTTCLHLAARNGHTDVIRLLLNAGVDINRTTLRGTALHEAAMHGKLEVVKMLIESGVDVNKPNSYDQTALDIVRSFTGCHAEKEMKQLLEEIINAVQAKAIRDYDEPGDPNCLPLKEGQQVTVLEQRADGRWRGIVFHPNYTSQSGYFPATAVQLADRQIGPNRGATIKSGTIRKVLPPVVPDLSYRNSGSSFSSGYGSNTMDRNSCGSLIGDEPLSPPPPNSPTSDSYGALPSPSKPAHFCFSESQYTQVIVHAQPDSGPTTPVDNPPGPLGSTTVCQMMLEDQGIDVCPSPGGSSASGTSSRHSMSSVDSGRASGSDKMGSQRSYAKPHNHQLDSAQQRHSYHSSSSSVSSEDLQILGSNVAEMVLHGVPDPEILSAWLISLKFEEYCPLFIQAGYDMPTISRMTPEDLTAIGITKPNHRRKLKAEIARLNISDGIPDYKPSSLLEWLHVLRLEEYFDTLCHQGYDSVDKVTDLTWEDLEEIGIQKLGHQKKIMLAIKRVKDISNGIKRKSGHLIEPQEPKGTTANSVPRPSTLNNSSPYSYYSQEIAISTNSKISPSANDAGLEFKTFQQSPPKEELFHHYVQDRDCNSPAHLNNLYHPNVVTIQVRSTNRGRSLESLDMDDSVSTIQPTTYYPPPSDCWYDTISAWRQNGYDTDSELSVHEHHYSGRNHIDHSGAATLNRPKGMVKPRPIAKIIAKSRQPEHDLNDDDPKKLIESWSPHKSWNTLNSYGTLRSRKNPPPPPKRTNSIKNHEGRSIEAMKDEAFATCVKGLASRFVTDLPLVPKDSFDDFPPPPSPLSSTLDLCVREDFRVKDSEDFLRRDSTGKYRPRRKGSDVSTSSTESNTLPFANENVGTIKQRSAKGLADEGSPVPMRKSVPSASSCLQSKRTSAKKLFNDDNECAIEHSSGATDVIVDIENMLANLSTQLDAMLEYQLNED